MPGTRSKDSHEIGLECLSPFKIRTCRVPATVRITRFFSPLHRVVRPPCYARVGPRECRPVPCELCFTALSATLAWLQPVPAQQMHTLL